MAILLQQNCTFVCLGCDFREWLNFNNINQYPMANYALPHFGDLDPNNLEDYYEVEIDFNGQKIQIDLNFEQNKIDLKRLDIVKQFIGNIAAFNKANKKNIEQDYADENRDTVRTYVEHYIEYFDSEEISRFVDLNNTEATLESQLIDSLKLIRIGLYPDEEENFAVFDYSIDTEITDQLVVIFAYPSGEMSFMTIES
jgi:uncharacterized protein YpmS